MDVDSLVETETHTKSDFWRTPGTKFSFARFMTVYQATVK